MSDFHAVPKPVTLELFGKKYVWGDAKQWVLFGGCNSFESAELMHTVAEAYSTITTELKIPWIFKCSWDKANRQSLKGFRTASPVEALKTFAEIKKKYACPIITDVHETGQVAMVAEVADVIQIPAFLCRQTDLVVEAAKTGKVIHIKKGQFMAPWDMRAIVDKCYASGNEKILLCERGSSFGYNRLVVDMTGLAEMRKMGVPVVMDATHSVQLPGGKGTASDGRREMIPLLARAALAAGVDGLFLEAHPDPERALCDGPNMLYLKEIPALLRGLQKLYQAL